VHGVLLLSYAGALLLVSATVLLLAYGPEGLGGGGRAVAVLALNAALAAVAAVCHRRPVLRLVETTYLALSVLTVPLSLAALYVYVVRGATGMTTSTALALGGAGCAVLYARMAALLRSTTSAALCLVTATVAAVSAAVAVGAGRSRGGARHAPRRRPARRGRRLAGGLVLALRRLWRRAGSAGSRSVPRSSPWPQWDRRRP
jgi:hypothetical protein